MKQFLLALFILSVGFTKAQCTLTSSVTPPTCPGTCDAKVSLYLSSGCASFPYLLTLNSGTCLPTGSFVITSPSAGPIMTFTGLCSCSGLISGILTNTLSIPVAFTNITLLPGIPVTVVPAAFQASCSSCCNGSATAVALGGTAPYSYTWTNATSSVVSTGSTMTNACPGTYSLCVADTKGCTTCTVVTIGFASGLVENEISPVKITYANDEIVITDNAPINALIVYDLTGRMVYRSENSGQKEIRLNKNQFNKGIYVMSIEGNYRLSKHKIVFE